LINRSLRTLCILCELCGYSFFNFLDSPALDIEVLSVEEDDAEYTNGNRRISNIEHRTEEDE